MYNCSSSEKEITLHILTMKSITHKYVIYLLKLLFPSFSFSLLNAISGDNACTGTKSPLTHVLYYPVLVITRDSVQPRDFKQAKREPIFLLTKSELILHNAKYDPLW